MSGKLTEKFGMDLLGILSESPMQYTSHEGESKNLSTKQEKINTYC